MADSDSVVSKKRKLNRSLSEGDTPSKVLILKSSNPNIDLVYPFEWMNSSGSGSSSNITLSPNGAIINTPYGIAINPRSPLYINSNTLTLKTDDSLVSNGSQLSVKLSPPLLNSPDGISINLGKGLNLTGGYLNVTSSSPCLNVDSNGISLNFDDQTLSIENGKLTSLFYRKIEYPLNVNNNLIGIKLDTSTMQVDTDGNLKVKLHTNSVLKESIDGIYLNTDDTLTSTDILSVRLNQLGGLSSDTDGIKINYDPSTMTISQGMLTVLPSSSTNISTTDPLEILDGNISLKIDSSLSVNGGSLSVVPLNYTSPIENSNQSIKLLFKEPLYIDNGELTCRTSSSSSPITTSNPLQNVNNNISLSINTECFKLSSSNALDLNYAMSSPIFNRSGEGGGMDIRILPPLTSINSLTLSYDTTLTITETSKLSVRRKLISGLASSEGIYVNTSSPIYINENDQVTLKYDTNYFNVSDGKLTFIPTTVSDFMYMEYYNPSNSITASAQLTSGKSNFKFYCNLKLVYSSRIVNGVISLNSSSGMLPTNNTTQPLKFDVVLSPASYATDLSGFAGFTFFPNSSNTKQKFIPSSLYGYFKSITQQTDWYDGSANALSTKYYFQPVSSSSSITFGESSMVVYPVQFSFGSAPHPAGLVLSFSIPNGNGNILASSSNANIYLPFIHFCYYAD